MAAARAFRLAIRALGVLILAIGGLVAAGAVVLAAEGPPRGRMVEVAEGRRQHLVCEGPRSVAHPVAWFESGAWGVAADWAAVQARLTALGWRSCAYDRAGMGYSDPGPEPRDALAIAGDLDRLMTASGEADPVVLVAHSAGGLYLRAFTGLRPDLVRGVVLVDAMTPEAVRAAGAEGFRRRFQRSAKWLAFAATIGLTKPLALTGLADRIGLPDYAVPEKRHALGSGRHNRTAADEVAAWPLAIAQAGAAPRFRPDWPVAVVTARREGGPAAAFNQTRAAPARAAIRGRVDVVDGAEHRTLLGEVYGGRIADAVIFVADEGRGL